MSFYSLCHGTSNSNQEEYCWDDFDRFIYRSNSRSKQPPLSACRSIQAPSQKKRTLAMEFLLQNNKQVSCDFKLPLTHSLSRGSNCDSVGSLSPKEYLLTPTRPRFSLEKAIRVNLSFDSQNLPLMEEECPKTSFMNPKAFLQGDGSRTPLIHFEPIETYLKTHRPVLRSGLESTSFPTLRPILSFCPHGISFTEEPWTDLHPEKNDTPTFDLKRILLKRNFLSNGFDGTNETNGDNGDNEPNEPNEPNDPNGTNILNASGTTSKVPETSEENTRKRQKINNSLEHLLTRDSKLPWNTYVNHFNTAKKVHKVKNGKPNNYNQTMKQLEWCKLPVPMVYVNKARLIPTSAAHRRNLISLLNQRDCTLVRTRYQRGSVEALGPNLENHIIEKNRAFSVLEPYQQEFTITEVCPKTKRALSTTRKALCGFCEEIRFFELKNSNYSQHMCHTHGIFTNNYITPDPLFLGIYQLQKPAKISRKTHRRARPRQGVVCPVCYEVIEIRCWKSKLDVNPFSNYLRHFKKQHHLANNNSRFFEETLN